MTGAQPRTINLGIYSAFSRIPWPKSYFMKILAVCFVGTHIPLIVTVILGLWLVDLSGGAKLAVLGLLLVGTIIGTVATIVIVRGMLAPVAAIDRNLTRFRDRDEFDELPQVGNDELSDLMQTVNTVVRRVTQTRKELEALSFQDDLVGIGNRRWLLGRASEILSRSEQNWRPTTIALIDLDAFKHINDTCGHNVGDEVLKEISDILAEHSRPTDLLGRIGGDEFCIIFLKCRAQEAEAAIDRMRAAIAARGLSERFDVPVSISCGLTERHDSRENLDETFARADEALYAAKAAGRNRTQIAPPAATPGT